jgi:hypothetical protein
MVASPRLVSVCACRAVDTARESYMIDAFSRPRDLVEGAPQHCGVFTCQLNLPDDLGLSRDLLQESFETEFKKTKMKYDLGSHYS